MKKYIFSIFGIFLLGFFSTALAKPVSMDEANIIAQTWMKKKTGKAHKVINHTLQRKTQKTKNYHIVHLEPSGWVIVSGDDIANPIIGYSSAKISPNATIPEAMQSWLSAINKDIQNAKNKNIQQSKPVRQAWIKVKKDISPNIRRSAGDNNYIVKPLLWMGGNSETSGILWSQESPYNTKCPNGSLVGCVATAMGQIMRYYRYPNIGVSSHSYNHNTYGTLSANFADVPYNWNVMPYTQNCETLPCSLDERATVLYEIAVSVNMVFSPNGSGALDADAQKAFQNYFNYTATLYWRNGIGVHQWHTAIKNVLNNNNPLFYGGANRNNDNGHAFVLDGYDADGYYHFNWGWGGDYNGKFLIDNLVPNYKSSFSYNQSMIVAIPNNQITPPVDDIVLTIADANLKRCILDTLGLTENSSIIFSQAQNLVSLDCSNRNIIDISSLSNFSSLSSLNIVGNYIDDFSQIPNNAYTVGMQKQLFYPDTAEANNEYSNATLKGNGITHHSLQVGDVDWYKMIITTPGIVTMQTSGTKGDTVLQIWKENSLMDENDDIDSSQGNYFSKIVRYMNAGEYSVAVKEYGQDNPIRHYTLEFQLPSPPDSNISLTPVIMYLLN